MNVSMTVILTLSKQLNAGSKFKPSILLTSSSSNRVQGLLQFLLDWRPEILKRLPLRRQFCHRPKRWLRVIDDALYTYAHQLTHPHMQAKIHA